MGCKILSSTLWSSGWDLTTLCWRLFQGIFDGEWIPKWLVVQSDELKDIENVIHHEVLGSIPQN